VQEWLSLHGHHVAFDINYTATTEKVVKDFQDANGLGASGRVDRQTFDLLVAPMRKALAPITMVASSLGELVVQYAKQHLDHRPREIGGQNMGPWVRLYMNGNEGPSWAWCAGFACFVLRQAADTLGRPVPIKSSFSCDLLATSATASGCLLCWTPSINVAKVTPGSIFLSRRIVGDWVHTGIVVKADAQIFTTIEGNTNDAGDREGYEVCQRVRGYKDKDFILIA